MQYVAFNLGDEVLCMSKPSTPEASHTPQDIYEMRLDRVTHLQHNFLLIALAHWMAQKGAGGKARIPL